MNSKFIFVFLFIFLAILVTMYYFNLNSSLTCLLTVIIILLLHKLIVQKEYFNDNKKEVMINIVKNLISDLEVKTTPATPTQASTQPQAPATTTSQDIIPVEEKKSFLDILKEILSDLNKK